MVLYTLIGCFKEHRFRHSLLWHVSLPGWIAEHRYSHVSCTCLLRVDQVKQVLVQPLFRHAALRYARVDQGTWNKKGTHVPETEVQTLIRGPVC